VLVFVKTFLPFKKQWAIAFLLPCKTLIKTGLKPVWLNIPNFLGSRYILMVLYHFFTMMTFFVSACLFLYLVGKDPVQKPVDFIA